MTRCQGGKGGGEGEGWGRRGKVRVGKEGGGKTGDARGWGEGEKGRALENLIDTFLIITFEPFV